MTFLHDEGATVPHSADYSGCPSDCGRPGRRVWSWYWDGPAWHRFLVGGVLGAVLALAVGGCGALNPMNALHPKAASHPVAPPPRISVMSWPRHSLHVRWVFADDASRAQGLQHQRIGPTDAAVFTWGGQPTETPFWMINTPEALSLVWISSGRVVGHVEMLRCAMSCPTYKPPAAYDTAVEAPAGTFAALRRGQRVNFQ